MLYYPASGEITRMGVLRMLEAIRIHTQGKMNGVRFYQASSPSLNVVYCQ